MGFLKKTWKNRQSEHPTRRKLVPVSGVANTYDVERAEGLVLEEGAAFDAATMNDLENRIAGGFADCGFCPCTHQKAGKVHRLTGEGENLRFAATADFAGGDTFAFNGRVVTARTLAGEPLWPGYFKAGSVVVCHKNGDSLTFSGGGLGSADKKTAEDFLPETKSLLGGNVKGTVPELRGDANDYRAAATDATDGKIWLKPEQSTCYLNNIRWFYGQIPALTAANIKKGVRIGSITGSCEQSFETVAQEYRSTRGYGTSGWLSTPEFAIPQNGMYVVFLCAGGDRYRGRENFYKNGSVVKQYSGYSDGRTYVEAGYMTAGTTFKAEAGYSYSSEDAYNLGVGMYIARIT